MGAGGMGRWGEARAKDGEAMAMGVVGGGRRPLVWARADPGCRNRSLGKRGGMGWGIRVVKTLYYSLATSVNICTCMPLRGVAIISYARVCNCLLLPSCSKNAGIRLFICKVIPSGIRRIVSQSAGIWLGHLWFMCSLAQVTYVQCKPCSAVVSASCSHSRKKNP